MSKPELKPILVHETKDQRFYKLNNPLTKGIVPSFGRDVDILKEIKDDKAHRIHSDYVKYLPKNGCDLVCVSDAHTHDERLVFVGLNYVNKDGVNSFGRTSIQIDGAHTMSIHGGSSSSMKDDFVYLRRLASLNGYKLTKPTNHE